MNKRMVIVIVLVLALLQGSYYVPRAYSLSYTDTEKAFAFLTDVIQLDLTEYQPVVKFAGPIDMGSLGPSTEVFLTLASDIPLLSGSTEAGFHCIWLFSNGTPYSFSMNGANMTMHYTSAQPSTALDTSKAMLERYQSYLTQYCGIDSSFLQPMATMLNNVAEPTSTVQVSDNVQMKIDYSSGIQQISSIEKALVTKTYINWVYTYNGVNVDRKQITLDFPNGTLSHFMDTWTMFTVGTWNIIPKEEALSMAFSAAQEVTLKLINSTGQTYEIDPDLSNSTSASLVMTARNNGYSVLYPFWYIEIPFVKSYGNMIGIQVGIWADTKEIAYCQAIGVLGQTPPDGSTTPSFLPIPLATNSKTTNPPATIEPTQTPQANQPIELNSNQTLAISIATIIAASSAISLSLVYFRRRKGKP